MLGGLLRFPQNTERRWQKREGAGLWLRSRSALARAAEEPVTAGLGVSPPAPSCPPALLRLSSSDYTKILTRVLTIQVGK